jgi:hypothetical protein
MLPFIGRGTPEGQSQTNDETGDCEKNVFDANCGTKMILAGGIPQADTALTIMDEFRNACDQG